MSHDHTHSHAHGHHHGHEETLHERRTRYLRSMLLGYRYVGFQILILYFLIKRSFGGESDIGHGFVDSTNYFFGFLVTFALARGWVTHQNAEKYGVWINSLFYFIGASYIFYEIGQGERFHNISWYWLLLLGAVGFRGNYLQHKVFGHHGEGSSRQDRSTEGHIIYDLLNSVFVMMVALFLFIIEWPVFPVIKAFIAGLLIVTSAIFVLIKYIDHEKWGSWQWFLYQAGIFLLTCSICYLVYKAQIAYIDVLLGALVAAGMAITGLLLLVNPDAHHH